jgi:transposase
LAIAYELWQLRTGARWQDLPARFPPYQTCHRRFQRWAQDGTLARVPDRLARDLRERGGLDVGPASADGAPRVVTTARRRMRRVRAGKGRWGWRRHTALLLLSAAAAALRGGGEPEARPGSGTEGSEDPDEERPRDDSWDNEE